MYVLNIQGEHYLLFLCIIEYIKCLNETIVMIIHCSFGDLVIDKRYDKIHSNNPCNALARFV